MYKRLVFLFMFCCTVLLVFSQKKGVDKAVSVKEKNYNHLKSLPVTTFCGKTGGFILLDSIKKTQGFLISPLYTLKSASVYFGGSGFTNPIVVSIASTSLGGGMADLFKRCREGTRIAFINIKVINANKIYDATDMIFTIKDKL
jgi:hypothetical protein